MNFTFLINGFLYHFGYFFITGSITCFIDLLTTPIVTFAIPILVYFMLLQKNEEYSIKQSVLIYLKIAILWAIGFFSTWIIKWILVDILFDRNVIKTSLKQFLYRIGNNADGLAEYYTIYNALSKNINYFGSTAIIIVNCIFFVGLLPIIQKKEKIKIVNLKYITPYIVTSILPILWFAILKNHSIHHPFFTNRNIIVTILGLDIAIVSILNLLPQKNQS